MRRETKGFNPGTFAALRRVRQAYRNWPSVLGTCALGWEPHRLRLRRGGWVAFGEPPRIGRWLAFEILPGLLASGWAIEQIDSTHGRLSHAGENLRFTCRFLGKWSDVIPLYEVFVGRVYDGDYRGKVVVDVGMAGGESSVFFARAGAARVIGVEPIPESYTLAVENLRQNALGDVVVPIQGAVLEGGDVPTVIQVQSSAPNRSSATPGDDRTEATFDRQLTVRTLGVPELLRVGNVNHIDVVKMDCEGCEYTFLRSLKKEDFDCIGRFVLEYHDGPRDLPQILMGQGFRVTYGGTEIGILNAERVSPPDRMGSA